jgi:hypothetical protein
MLSQRESFRPGLPISNPKVCMVVLSEEHLDKFTIDFNGPFGLQ